MNWRGRRNR